jgi:hypothetical protein
VTRKSKRGCYRAEYVLGVNNICYDFNETLVFPVMNFSFIDSKYSSGMAVLLVKIRHVAATVDSLHDANLDTEMDHMLWVKHVKINIYTRKV